jgi:hypothetical protein
MTDEPRHNRLIVFLFVLSVFGLMVLVCGTCGTCVVALDRRILDPASQ